MKDLFDQVKNGAQKSRQPKYFVWCAVIAFIIALCVAPILTIIALIVFFLIIGGKKHDV